MGAGNCGEIRGIWVGKYFFGKILGVKKWDKKVDAGVLFFQILETGGGGLKRTKRT